MAKKKSAKGKRSGVTAEEFCQQWRKHVVAGKTMDDLSKALGMSKSSIQSRRNSYRTQLGLKFPKLVRGSSAKRHDKVALQRILSGK
jgi:transposase